MAWKITIGLVLLLSAFGAGYCTNWLESRRYIESVDQRFNDIAIRNGELERINSEVEQRVSDLSGRIELAQSIVIRLSEQGGSALEKVKRVIENLRRLQEILRL
jgi:hypothetical protein